MDVFALSAKAAVALLLLVAGGAKLAGLPSFAAAVRMFLPRRAPRPLVEGAACAIAVAEVLLGLASFSFPEVRVLNLAVFAATCSFVAVSTAGYAYRRGRSCRCFGPLSHATFDAPGIVRSVLIAALAGFATASVPAPSVELTWMARLLLLGGAILLGVTSFTAASALENTSRAEPRLAPK